MRRFSVIVLILGVLTGFGLGQTAAQPQLANREKTPEAHSLGRGSVVLQVVKTLDSSKLKAGDAVEFTTAGAFLLRDGTKVAEGTRVTSHIVESKARASGDSVSELAISFDQIQLNKEKQLSLKAVLQAVGEGPPEDAPVGPPASTMAKESGSAGAGWTPPDVKSGSNTHVVVQAPPTVTHESTGVLGFKGLQLGANGVISSSGKNVKLGSGTRIVVRTEIFD